MTRTAIAGACALLTLLSLILLTGCARYVGERIVRAPNLDNPTGIFNEDMETAWQDRVADHFFVERTRLTAPGDEIDLHAVILPSGDYPNRLAVERDDGGLAVDFNAAMPIGPPRAPSRGTIIGIHGWQTEHRALLYHAMELAGEGWDVVLYDQRGHGRSGGKIVTFGAREAQDLQTVIEWTRKRGEFTPPLVLFGTSMGASTALLAAADSPVDAVVAVAPYARLNATLPRALRSLAPFYIRPFLSASRIEKALGHAQEISGVALSDVAPITRAEEVNVPVLLIHSEADQFVPVEHGHKLHEALPNATLTLLEELPHQALLIDREAVLDQALPWLEHVTPQASVAPDQGNARSR